MPFISTQLELTQVLRFPSGKKKLLSLPQVKVSKVSTIVTPVSFLGGSCAYLGGYLAWPKICRFTVKPVVHLSATLQFCDAMLVF